MSAQTSVPTVAGVCTLLITVTAIGLEGREGSQADKRWQGYPWGVDVDGIPMWASSEYNDLALNSGGIAVGTVQVSIRQLLEALAERFRDMTVRQILDATTTVPQPPDLYPDWALWVSRTRWLPGQPSPGRPADAVTSGIDMGVTHP